MFSSGTLDINLFKPKELHIPLKSKEGDVILKYLNLFLNEDVRSDYRALGNLYKTGMVLYGKHGTGKTTLMNYLGLKLVKEHNAIVIISKGNTDSFLHSWALAQEIRKVQDNLIVMIKDECEDLLNNENAMKERLDGNESIDNFIFMGATNYFNEIPKTISKRLSRIRWAIEIIGVQDKDVIRKMLSGAEAKLGRELFFDLEERVDSLVGSTVDEIKTHITDFVLNERFNQRVDKNGRPMKLKLKI